MTDESAKVVQSVEEAWAALEFRQGDEPQVRAARALALAVLDKLERAALLSANVEIEEGFVEDVITPLRAQIEALGR